MVKLSERMWCIGEGTAAAGAVLGLIVSLAAVPAGAAEMELVNALTPWRLYLVLADRVERAGGKYVYRDRRRWGSPVVFDPAATVGRPGLRMSPLPSADWVEARFDDSCWPRYVQDDLDDYLGQWGAAVNEHCPMVARICLRTRFGVAQPGQVGDLKLKIVCLGGAVAYVNGQEVGRGYVPAGEIHPLTLAEDYPLEAYTAEDGKTALPVLMEGKTPGAKWGGRYDRRIRTITLDVPSRVLVKGGNVVAIALHWAPVAGPCQRWGWNHVGIREVQLTSASGQGLVSYAAAAQGTHVWSASAVDQVTETLAAKSLVKRSWFWAMYWGRGMPVKGVPQGNPFDRVLPVKLTVPRNGVGSGQTVLSDGDGLRGVSAGLGPWEGPGGAVLPAGAVEIRYAVQHPGVHYCDALMAKPPEGAKTVPVWLVIRAQKDQAPGWYVSTLRLRANGKEFAVPVQVLVTGSVLPDARDFSSAVGMTESPETVAKQYSVDMWSDAHFKVLEKSFALLGQVGNDVVHVPVITSGVGGSGKSRVGLIGQPLIRWVKTGPDLKPDFTLLDKYLDAYTRHCAPPKALSIHIWGVSSAKEIADAYEGRRIPTRQNVKYTPPTVAVWDPKTGTAADHPAPAIGDDGSEAFWRPMLEGVHALVTRRGWSERIIMLGLGGDIRPGQKTCQLLKQWAPYARWDFLSHFSGDPGPKDGKLIATGGMEVGMREWPFPASRLTLPQLEERLEKPYDFLELPTDRWLHQEYSPPLTFRTMTATWGNIGRLGLDFWLAGKGGPRSTTFFSHVNSLTVPGPDGAVPTVRFQMLRECVQDAEIRIGIVKAYLKLPAEQRRPYQEVLEDLAERIRWGSPVYLSQNELCYDWPAYVARLHLTADELCGVKTDAKWEQPPRGGGGCR